MIEVRRPQKQPDGLGTLGTLAGAGIGAMAGNPMAGASIGGTVGGLAETATAQAPGQNIGGGSAPNYKMMAIQGRIDANNPEESHTKALENGLAALQSQPPEVQAAFGPTLEETLKMARQNQMRG